MIYLNISSIENYLNGNLARDLGALEEEKNCGCGQTPCITYGSQSESVIEEEVFCEIDIHHDLHEILQDAMTEDNEKACPECLYEVMVDSACDCSEMLSEAEYRGRKVKLNKPMRGDVKKFKVFVKDPKFWSRRVICEEEGREDNENKKIKPKGKKVV